MIRRVTKQDRKMHRAISRRGASRRVKKNDKKAGRGGSAVPLRLAMFKTKLLNGKIIKREAASYVDVVRMLKHRTDIRFVQRISKYRTAR